MVNVKSAIAFGLLAATASAATVNNGKRHAHHKRHTKKPCTTGTAPYPVNNGTLPSTSSREVVTVSVVPVPVTPTAQATTSAPALPTSVASQPASAPAAPPASSPSGAPVNSAPPPAVAAPSCAVETTIVTVQQTITVTAGQIPETTSSVPAVVPSTSTSTTTEVAPTSSAPAVVPVVASSAPAPPAPSSSAAPPPPPVPSSSAAPPAPSSSAAPATSSPAPSASNPAPVSAGPGTYHGKKMGTSWNPGQNWDFSALGISIGASWCYDWGQAPHGVPSGVEYVPSLHDESKCGSIASDLASSGSSFLKHFNEPDQSVGAGGSALSPSRAAELHSQYIAPLMSQYSVGLPSVSSNNIPGQSGTGWLEAFVQQVGCKGFSFADFHWYGGGEDAATQAKIFLDYVDNWISTVDQLCPNQNLPLWISEVSATPVGDLALATQFMAAVGPSLENNPRIARYAYWFPENNQIGSALSDIASALAGLGLSSIIG